MRSSFANNMESQISAEQIAATLKFLRDNDRDREVRAALEERYPDLHPERLPKIFPKWDLSAEALKHNELREDILAAAILHIAEPSAFLEVCTYPSDYATDDLEKRSSSHKLRRILDHWDSQTALTPPVFMWLHDKLLKLDGHHRTLLAFALRAIEIPFYCDQPIEKQGIRICRYPNTNQGEQAGTSNGG
jgi:hypothetical protein